MSYCHDVFSFCTCKLWPNDRYMVCILSMFEASKQHNPYTYFDIFKSIGVLLGGAILRNIDMGRGDYDFLYVFFVDLHPHTF